MSPICRGTADPVTSRGRFAGLFPRKKLDRDLRVAERRKPVRVPIFQRRFPFPVGALHDVASWKLRIKSNGKGVGL